MCDLEVEVHDPTCKSSSLGRSCDEDKGYGHVCSWLSDLVEQFAEYTFPLSFSRRLVKVTDLWVTRDVAGIGFVLAAMAMVVAGVVEIARKDRMEEPGGVVMQDLGGETFEASSLSVFVQVPQFALVGASEVFASICGLEFAYTQAPKSMQGVIMGLFLVTSGLGGFLATGILNAVQAATKDYPWFDDEINNAHVEYYFFLLSGLMILDFLIFLVIAKFYRYRNTVYDELSGDEIHVEPGRGEIADDNTQF